MVRCNRGPGRMLQEIAFWQAFLVLFGGIFATWAHLAPSQLVRYALAASVAVFWLLADIAAPLAGRVFQNEVLSPCAWLGAAASDLVCFGGILWFLQFMAVAQNKALTGAVIFAVGAIQKPRKETSADKSRRKRLEME